jgi:uncharacterized delta-60 repeat protein
MNPLSLSARQAGALDESFGDEGIFRLSIPAVGTQTSIFGVTASLPSTPERLYFTGSVVGDSTESYLLGRLLPEGLLDKSFAVDGIASDSFGTSPISIGKSILLADGKILLVGQSGEAPALAQFLSDGTPDREFGSDGHVILPYPRGLQAQPPGQSKLQNQDSTYSVSASAERQFLIVKTFRVSDTSRIPLAYLLNIDGSLDTSFNETGYIQVVHPEHDPDAITMSSGYIDEKGRIMVAGNLLLRSGRSMPLFVCYTPDGRPDTTFGNGGFVVSSSPSTQYTTIKTIIRQPNNRILAIGWAAGREQGLLISLEPDGKPNIQFNRGQPLLTQLNFQFTSWQRAVMQPDGKIVLLGSIRHPDEKDDVIVARLLSDGRDDLSFNGKGWVSHSPGTVNIFEDLTLQDDGKIVVVGFLLTSETHGVILRFHGRS